MVVCLRIRLTDKQSARAGPEADGSFRALRQSVTARSARPTASEEHPPILHPNPRCSCVASYAKSFTTTIVTGLFPFVQILPDQRGHAEPLTWIPPIS